MGKEKLCISELQRKLLVGYAMAGRIIDALIKVGVLKRDSETKELIVIKEKIDLLLPFIDMKDKSEREKLQK